MWSRQRGLLPAEPWRSLLLKMRTWLFKQIPYSWVPPATRPGPRPAPGVLCGSPWAHAAGVWQNSAGRSLPVTPRPPCFSVAFGATSAQLRAAAPRAHGFLLQRLQRVPQPPPTLTFLGGPFPSCLVHVLSQILTHSPAAPGGNQPKCFHGKR